MRAYKPIGVYDIPGYAVRVFSDVFVHFLEHILNLSLPQ
jgi:hypothetical protein